MKSITESSFIPARLLDESNAAAYIGATPDTLKLSRHTGELYKGVPAPAHTRCGRSIRYSRAVLDQWLSELPQYASNAAARASGIEIRVINRKSPSKCSDGRKS